MLAKLPGMTHELLFAFFVSATDVAPVALAAPVEIEVVAEVEEVEEPPPPPPAEEPRREGGGGR